MPLWSKGGIETKRMHLLFPFTINTFSYSPTFPLKLLGMRRVEVMEKAKVSAA